MYCLPCFDTGDIIKKGHLVTKIKTWGPEYKILFKIKLNPFTPTRVPQEEPYYNLVLFAKNATHCKPNEYGCRIPAVHFRQVDNLPQFYFMVGQSQNQQFEQIWQWNKWYTITIEHKVKDGKDQVFETDHFPL